MKCPNCRKGNMFKNKSYFPLKEMLDMPDECENCGQPMEIEPGFYYGTGYVSYGVTIAVMVAVFVAYHVFFGIQLMDNSIIIALIISIIICIISQPWIMRISRVLYLYMFVKYKQGGPKTIKNKNE